VLVASGLFVALALVLLILGLQTSSGLQVYLSIGASLVASALLALGVRSRRPPAGVADREPDRPVS